MVKWIFIDLDDTLIESAEQLRTLWGQAFRQFGIALSDISTATLPQGAAANEVIRCVAPQLERSDADAICELFAQLEEECCFPLVEGAATFVREVHALGYRIALVTNSSEQKVRNVFEQHPQLGVIDEIVHRGRFGRPKPAPDAYLCALRASRCDRREVVALEDSLNGVMAARCAGVPVVAFRNAELATQYAIPSLTQLDLFLFSNAMQLALVS